MCGIAGLVARDLTGPECQAAARRMSDRLAHRGPDDSAVWFEPNAHLALAHRRLAIQDLSPAGAQPMQSASGRYCIVFNGEIYNFRELKRELEGRGHEFRGHSDTEVLLASIEEWGIEAAVRRTVGMFAFGLWDAQERQLSLCRDRMGEKPLYYGWLGDTFCFASELKAIKAIDSGGELQVNPDAVAAYLRFLYVPAPLSIYRNIYKLLPGSIFTLPLDGDVQRKGFDPNISSSGLSPKAYWSVREAALAGLAKTISDDMEAADELEAVLRKTIDRQMIADVELGAFLSGGIDSSTVSALAQSQSTQRIRTFTIGFDDAKHDESKFAEDIARHLGTEHLTLHATARDGLDLVPGLAQMFDEPFADSSQIPTHIVSKLAREHVTVCLSGDGGDELFAGYNRYLWADKLWQRFGNIPLGARQLMGRVGGALPTGARIHKAAKFLQSDSLENGYEYLLTFWHDPQIGPAPNDGRSSVFNGVPAGVTDFIDRAMFADQVGYLPGDNLCKVDRASMAVSLETRLPLLSHEVVELSWRIPLHMKVRHGSSKWLLRQVLYKNVPRELIERPKMGFTVPLRQWLEGDLRSWAEDMFRTMNSAGKNFLDERRVRELWDGQISGQQDNSSLIWSILMLLSWLEAHG